MTSSLYTMCTFIIIIYRHIFLIHKLDYKDCLKDDKSCLKWMDVCQISFCFRSVHQPVVLKYGIYNMRPNSRGQ